MEHSQQFSDTPEKKRSRRAYCAECTFEYLVALLVSDAFLTKLLLELGFDDASVGIISSFVSLAFLFQLLSVFVAQKIRNVKKVSILFHSIGQLFFMALYLLPFLPCAAEHRRGLSVVCILLAYFGNYLVTSVIFRWGNSNVSPEKRASYTAVKECISLACGMAVSLIVGAVMDSFEAQGRLRSGFCFAAIAVFLFCVCDFVCLLLIKNQDAAERNVPDIKLRAVLRGTVGNSSFRHLLVLEVLWKFGTYLTLGFLGTYKLNYLMFTVVQIQLITVASNLGRICFSRFFGKFSDRYSYARGLELAAAVAVVSFICGALSAPGTRLLILLQSVLYQISQAGCTGNLQNITYSYVEQTYFVQASAIKNSVGGLCGFGAALLGGKILSAVQGDGNQLLGFGIYGQQVLSVLSALVLLAALLYTHFVIDRQTAVRQ